VNGLERRVLLVAMVMLMILVATGRAIGALIVLVAVMMIVMGVMVVVIMVFVVVLFGAQKIRFDLQNTLEIEGVLLQHGL
jgi:hypothetical protein